MRKTIAFTTILASLTLNAVTSFADPTTTVEAFDYCKNDCAYRYGIQDEYNQCVVNCLDVARVIISGAQLLDIINQAISFSGESAALGRGNRPGSGGNFTPTMFGD